MSPGTPRRVRCAIYTRKSSDEGLEQAFNSLDAQREACAAYILSQASEGWTALPATYDDGGLSGGTLERPALKRLLADIADGQVDIIVVYKVDRLTRSLFDFAKLVETFDKANVSFVSVTQSFNTTTSMGRLTLNMLLSFAQFEREVTAERIRDKIAASKARGMWMGGTPPVGYAPDGRTLKPVEPDAALIRDVFQRYLRLGNVRLVADELQRDGMALPVRQRLNGGSAMGGGWFSRGQIYKILSNPIYIGRIAHRSTSYAGLHPAIIDTDTWEHTQAKLVENRQGARTRTRAASPSLLAGRVVDADGQPLIASHASKGKTRYRYYISRDLQRGIAKQGFRIPAVELEAAVTQQVANAFDDPFTLAGIAGLTITTAAFANLDTHAAATAGLLRARKRDTVAALIQQVRVRADRVEIEIDTAGVAAALQLDVSNGATATFTLTAGVTLTRTGRSLRLVQDNGSAPLATPDRSLVRLLVQARGWWAVLRAGELSATKLAAREGVTPSYLTRVVRLVFLSPAVTEAIIAGRQRAGVTAASLTLENTIAADWRAQAATLLPARMAS